MSSTVPARKPANDSVGIQPTAAGVAPNSSRMRSSIGVWKCIALAVVKTLTASSAIRLEERRGADEDGAVSIADGSVIVRV